MTNEEYNTYTDTMYEVARKIKEVYAISYEDLFLNQPDLKVLIKKYNLSEEETNTLEPLLNEFYDLTILIDLEREADDYAD